MVQIGAGRGIPCNIFRLGLVWADTQQGRYDKLQRDYRLLKSCLLSGCGIENYRYDLPPTPVDYVARAIVFLANRHPNDQGIFHISATHQMAGGLFEHCNEILGPSLELLSLEEWIHEIKRIDKQGRTLPIVPLLEFYEQQWGLGAVRTRFECARTQAVLEQGGIVAPALNDDLLRVCLNDMISRDAQLAEWMDDRRNPPVPTQNSPTQPGLL
jgi:thioester reductase-like protein